jgi:hypothetical protein
MPEFTTTATPTNVGFTTWKPQTCKPRIKVPNVLSDRKVSTFVICDAKVIPRLWPKYTAYSGNCAPVVQMVPAVFATPRVVARTG